MANYTKEIRQFINKCKKNKTLEDYAIIEINENAQLWLQWYNGEYACIELQVKTNEQEDFGEYCINVNDLYEQEELNSFVNEQLEEINKIGIQNYIFFNKELFI